MACEKKKYLTRAHAELALEKLKRDRRQQSGASSDHKFLEVYPCRECVGFFHHGRKFKTARARYKALNAKSKSEPKHKPQSWAYIRKRVERIGQHLDRERQKQIAAINAMMEAERQIESNLAAMHELEKQIVSDYFAGRIR